MNSKLIAILLTLLMVVALAACGNTAPAQSSSQAAESASEAAPASEPESSQEAAPAEPQEITVTHGLGETTLTTDPQKVVVFDYGTLDALDYAGIEVIGLGMGGNLAPHLSKFSGDAYKVTGTLHEPDFEAVNELQPDLILIGARAATAYEELSKIAPTVLITMPTTGYMATFEDNMNILAQIFPSKADVFTGQVSEINTKVAAVKEKVAAADVNALVLMTNDSEISVFGLGSRFAIVYDDFGFKAADESIDQSTHGQSAAFEYIAEKNPDYLFVLDRGAATGSTEGTGAQQLMDNELVNGTKAAADGHIVYLDSTNWYVVSGGITSTNAMVDEVAASIQ